LGATVKDDSMPINVTLTLSPDWDVIIGWGMGLIEFFPDTAGPPKALNGFLPTPFYGQCTFNTTFLCTVYIHNDIYIYIGLETYAQEHQIKTAFELDIPLGANNLTGGPFSPQTADQTLVKAVPPWTLVRSLCYTFTKNGNQRGPSNTMIPVKEKHMFGKY